MPHIIIEYQQQVIKESQVDSMLLAIHSAIADSGLFKANQVKTRAYPFTHFSNAGEQDPYIHVQARIKSGRDSDNKKQLAEAILSGFKKLDIHASVVTVEIIDMDRESYGKYIPGS